MPLTTASNNNGGNYQLNLEQRKRNVFVTQLHEQQDFEDDDVRRFPVVKESSDELLQTGINTLQKTSLLRKAVEVKLVDEELAKKREEFRQRMAINKNKEEALKKKQEKIKERVAKFDKFLKDNEAKRSRALHKYQLEVRANKVRSKELAEIQREVEALKTSKDVLMEKLAKYKKFEDFLLRSVDVVPEDYIPVSGENVIESFIQRYEGLAATRQTLEQRNKEMHSSIEVGHRQLEELKQERNKQKLLFNQQLVDLQKEQEDLVQKNKRLEQFVLDTTRNQHFMASELGRILLAIDNLAQSCHTRHWPHLLDMSYMDKLNMLKQHFQDQVRVLKLIQRLYNTSHEHAAAAKVDKKSAHAHTKADDASPVKVPSALGLTWKPSSTGMSVPGLLEHLIVGVDENL